MDQPMDDAETRFDRLRQQIGARLFTLPKDRRHELLALCLVDLHGNQVEACLYDLALAICDAKIETDADLALGSGDFEIDTDDALEEEEDEI